MCPPVPKTKTSGLSSASFGRHLGRQYENEVRAYRRELAACRRRMSRHAVHRLRIDIRRLLACLELLDAVQIECPAVRGVLQRQLKTLGELRDIQVQLHRIEHEPRFAKALQPLCEHLKKREYRRMKAARKTLEADETLHRLRQWRLRPARKNPDVIPRLRALIDNKLQLAFDPLGSCSPSTPADSAARHRTRIIAREYRYVLETLRPSWRGAETVRLLASLQVYQAVIGQIHDREILLHRIERLVADARIKTASVRPFRALLQAEQTKQLKVCSLLDRRVLHEAMLARRHLCQNVLCN